MFREDEPMPLTSGEFAVLKALVSHPREPLSRDKLMNLARGREYSAMERSIDVQISACGAWWKRIRRIRATSRPSGVWATSLSRTVLRHETRLRFSPRSSFASHIALIVTLLFVSLVTTLSGGTKFRDPAESPAV